MITLTPTEAEDVINAQIKAALDAAAVGTLLDVYGPLITLWGNEERNKPNFSNKYGVRVSHQTVMSKQANMSNCEGVSGQKRYRTSGLTIIQVFAPTIDQQVQDRALKLATIARNGFRGQGQHATDDCVWFYNVRINKIPRENDLYRLNVVAEHEYDELG